MNIEQLQYVCMVAKTNSITIAAENLYVTQQTISKAINKLETELGTQLMIRSHKGVQLTEAGQLFVEKANHIVRDFQDLYDSLHVNAASNVTGKLSIYQSNYIGHILGAHFMVNMRRQYPKIDIMVQEMLVSSILQNIKNGDPKVALIQMVNHNSGVGRQEELEQWLDFEVILRDTLVACVSEKSSLAKRESVSLKELLRQPIAWGECFHMSDILLQDYDIEAKVLLNTTNMALQRSTIQEDAAVSFATEMIVNSGNFDTNGVKVIPIKENLRLESYLVKPKGYTWNKIEQLAIEELKRTLSHL